MSEQLLSEQDINFRSSQVKNKTPSGSRKREGSFINSNLNVSQRDTERFEDEQEYLKNITSVMKLDQGIQHILMAKGGMFQSILILELENETLISAYGGCKFVARCYRDRVKIFEIPLFNKMLPLPFIGREKGNFRIVFNTDQYAYNFPLNASMSDEEENYPENRYIIDSREKITVNGVNIKEIYAFGARWDKFNDYDEDIAELMYAVDQDDVIHVLRGKSWGKIFEPCLHYDSKEKLDTSQKITKLRGLMQATTYKIIAVLDKIKQGEVEPRTYLQIFQFTATKESMQPISMTQEFLIEEEEYIERQVSSLHSYILDRANQTLYLSDHTQGKENSLLKISIKNELASKNERIVMNSQVAMNIVANNKLNSDPNNKTKGLIYNDFLVAGNFVILISGKIITCYDIVDKSYQSQHIYLQDDRENDFYYQGNEVTAIWMMDKQLKDTSYSQGRWKIIIAFNNGYVKELKHDNKGNISLIPYLQDFNEKEVQLPGKIIKVFANRNSYNQPVYFLLKKISDNKIVLATIEFESKTYREFNIKDVDPEHTKFVILQNNDPKFFWQEIACFTTNQESQVQKLIQIKVRIGQHLDKRGSVQVINKDILPQSMDPINLVKDIFVCDKIIYFVHKKWNDLGIKAHIDQYDLSNNSHVKVPITENVLKLKVFNNQYFYWRTILGGINNDTKYKSVVYFDGIQDFQNFNKSHKDELKIAQGTYPHINKLQWDIMSDSVCFFTDFYTLQVIPLLHQNKIKVKVSGNRDTDDHILATKYFAPYFLITVHQSNQMMIWNMKTAKYLMNKKSFNNVDLSTYAFHQRINDEYTLLKEIEPIDANDLELFKNNFPKEFDQSDEQNNVQMYRYKIIKVEANEALATLDYLKIKVIKSFYGPGNKKNSEQGLYASDDLDLFIFFYLDNQEKIQLVYQRIQKDVQEFEPEFQYLHEIKRANEEDSKLTIHSPNFKLIVRAEFQGSRDYKIIDFMESEDSYLPTLQNVDAFLPGNLSLQTIAPPKFIKNDSLLFLTEDKIIKCFKLMFEKSGMKLKLKNLMGEADIEAEGEEDFIVSHCQFPGATENINLSTLLMVGNNLNYQLIGENCLTYVQNHNPNQQVRSAPQYRPAEYIAPNIYNNFFLEAAEEYQDQQNYNEMKMIQCHYKTKFEFDDRALFGYCFNQKTLRDHICTQLYTISSFTFYQWRLLNLIEHKKVNIAILPLKTIQDLSYCQLADGSTLLHRLYHNKIALEFVYSLVTLDQGGLDEKEPFHIPMLKNRKNKTALDYALGNSEEKKKGKRVVDVDAWEEKSENNKQIDKTIYRRPAELMIKNIAFYPFGLFNVETKHLIATMIRVDLFEFAGFMDNMAKTPSFIQGIDRARVEVEETCGACVFDTSNVWPSNVKDYQFEKEEGQGEDKLVQLKIVDIPNLHHYIDGTDNQIFQELSNTDNQDIFDIVTIKCLIEQKWALTREHVSKYLLFPYLAFLLVFTYYTVNDLETSYYDQQSEVVTPIPHDHHQFIYAIVCRVLILIFTSYFFAIEISQGYQEGFFDHMSNFWNYLDILPPILIFTSEIMNITNTDFRLIRTLYSFCSVAMWMRFMYFFRIFKETNFYIRMITEVIVDMGQFFFILAIGMILFGHTFYIFFLNLNIVDAEISYDSQGNQVVNLVQSSTTPYSSFPYAMIQSYTFAFGNFNFDDYAIYLPWVAWLFYILASLFVMIVMLNLLISIVGDTFGRVNDNRDRMVYQDMVDVIVENQFLISKTKQATLNSGRYLMLVVPEDNIQDEDEQIIMNFNSIKKSIGMAKKSNGNKLTEILQQKDRMLKGLKELSDMFDEKIVGRAEEETEEDESHIKEKSGESSSHSGEFH